MVYWLIVGVDCQFATW